MQQHAIPSPLCHSEHSEESPPFAQRKGARWMLSTSLRALHVIPSAARNLPPSRRVRGLGGCTNTPFRALHVIPKRSEESIEAKLA